MDTIASARRRDCPLKKLLRLNPSVSLSFFLSSLAQLLPLRPPLPAPALLLRPRCLFPLVVIGQRLGHARGGRRGSLPGFAAVACLGLCVCACSSFLGACSWVQLFSFRVAGFVSARGVGTSPRQPLTPVGPAQTFAYARASNRRTSPCCPCLAPCPCCRRMCLHVCMCIEGARLAPPPSFSAGVGAAAPWLAVPPRWVYGALL